jgi:hypothetical protein
MMEIQVLFYPFVLSITDWFLDQHYGRTNIIHPHYSVICPCIYHGPTTRGGVHKWKYSLCEEMYSASLDKPKPQRNFSKYRLSTKLIGI